MSFWASTLVDEVCQIAWKDKAIAKAKLIPLVYFMASRLCDLCVSASLWRHVHHGTLIYRSRCGLRRNTEKKENGDTESIWELLLLAQFSLVLRTPC